jgi:hypothetical protein
MKERNLKKATRLERMLLSSSDNKHIHVLCQDPCLEYHFGRDMTERTGKERGVPSSTQESQDFSAGVSAAHLTTQKSCESRSVDPINNGMINHYLRDVDHGSHCLPCHRTACFTNMSD